MEILTIKQKMSGTGNIHDIKSDQFDREIKFPAGCKYAVVLAAYYGGKGYSTHRTEGNAMSQASKLADYSKVIIDCEGRIYEISLNPFINQVFRNLNPQK